MMNKHTIIKYFFVAVILIVLLLNWFEILQSNLMYYILSVIFLVIAYLIIVKKFYFLSNLTVSNENGPYKFGTISGVVSLIIGAVFLGIAIFGV